MAKYKIYTTAFAFASVFGFQVFLGAAILDSLIAAGIAGICMLGYIIR